MASSKKSNKSRQQSRRASTASTGPKPPEGYEDASNRDYDIGGWWSVREGNTIHGITRRFFNYQGEFGEVTAVILELIDSADVESKDDGPFTAEPGDFIAISLPTGLLSLQDYALGSSVWIHVLEKKKLEGKKSLWQFDIRVKGVKVPTPRRSASGQRRSPRPPTWQSSTGQPDEDDDIPF